MIESAAEFRRLQMSEQPADYERAASEEVPVGVWRDIIHNDPEMRFWVGHNKTVPSEILSELIEVGDARTRSMVASKRSLPEAVQLVLRGTSWPRVDRTEGPCSILRISTIRHASF